MPEFLTVHRFLKIFFLNLALQEGLLIYNALAGSALIFEFNCAHENKYEVRESPSLSEFETKVRRAVSNFTTTFMVLTEADSWLFSWTSPITQSEGSLVMTSWQYSLLPRRHLRTGTFQFLNKILECAFCCGWSSAGQIYIIRCSATHW